MLENILIDGPDNCISVAEKIHKSLQGNPDYVGSDIVLNFDNCSEPQTTKLLVDARACGDPELAIQKAKEAIDILAEERRELIKER